MTQLLSTTVLFEHPHNPMFIFKNTNNEIFAKFYNAIFLLLFPWEEVFILGTKLLQIQLVGVDLKQIDN